MFMIVGGMIPTAILLPTSDLSPEILLLNSSWQIPSVLLSSIIFGPSISLIATVAYLTIGLFYLPIFHGGGSIGYLLTPDFGYLAGFIPAVLITGNLSQRIKKKKLVGLTISAFIGLLLIHIIGFFNLIVGNIINRWQFNFSDLFVSYSLSPLLTQLIICPCIAIVAIIIKRLLIIK